MENIIERDVKWWMRCSLVMLPSEEINKIGDICLFDYGINIAGVADIGYPTQHLYILNDEKAKNGDWAISYCDDESYETISSQRYNFN